jgi:voltage-gated potassium channel Kch
VSGPILVCGDNALGASVEESLRAQGAATHRLRCRSFELQPSDVAGAAALVLAGDGDGDNVSLALRARHFEPALPIVVRIFDSALVHYLDQTLPGVRVLSLSGVAAPLFANAAREVLASPGTRAPDGPPLLSRRRYRVDKTLIIALLSLFALVFPSAAYYSHELNLRYLDALYFVWTTVMTVGYGDIALKDASDAAKLYGMLLMLGGASFIAVLFALLSDWVLSRRLEVLQGRTPERGEGHIIMVGAGNVGYRVAGLLRGTGRRLVVIERDGERLRARELAAAGDHVIVADATAEETLAIAALPRAAIVLALTDSDAVNLQVALLARRCGVPVVLRADSPELAEHMRARGDAIAISPLTPATQAFVSAALEAARIVKPQ